MPAVPLARRATLLLVAVAAVVGCGRAEPRPAARAVADAGPPAVAPVDAAAAPAIDAAPVRGGADDPLAEKLRHCPAAVPGAVTVLQDIRDGIDLTITATAPAATAEIRRRGAHLVAFTAGRAGDDGRAEHGGGGGGGFMQNCPVVTRATSITASDIPRGVRLRVRPTGALTVAALRAETRRRLGELVRP